MRKSNFEIDTFNVTDDTQESDEFSNENGDAYTNIDNIGNDLLTGS